MNTPPGNSRDVAVAILAAGKGTRLKSKYPKVLHRVGGKPLLSHVIAAATRIVPASEIYVVLGHEAKQVEQAIADSGVQFIEQAEQRGTGHALQVARPMLEKFDTVVVLSGDAPLITSETIQSLLKFHRDKHAAMSLLSAHLPHPHGYGRILRAAADTDDVQHIIEEKSASPLQKKINEINAGFYVFSVRQLYEHIDELSTDNPHGEYYLTDMAEILSRHAKRVVAMRTNDATEVLGGNTRAELAEIDHKMRRAKCTHLMEQGVTIYQPNSCVIDADVQIGADTVLEPFVQLLGATTIGPDCHIESYSIIRDSNLAAAVHVKPGCVIEDSEVKRAAVLGPYAHLRTGSRIGEQSHIGNFVETKNTTLGRGSKANHLTYLGDAEIGDEVNVGAGTITCNYDGFAKHTTVLEDGAFIGSDSTLVAPVRIGKGAYVGAASCITEDVPDRALALARSRQTVKPDWAQGKGKRRQKAGASEKKS
ncbi:MAG: bifunctional UDP-N-acetylglucosamine diphosphorylase/glucosamine-1-phosphate N-acetyltransferase GlmU [Acidobacteriales bacterium]|nr:bifunctional UDP-N-acetylglucosamine diphosphorylase/glucosamine-1-phosphate N-acetyltransferase GlmU [Terriglobales bacterium]